MVEISVHSVNTVFFLSLTKQTHLEMMQSKINKLELLMRNERVFTYETITAITPFAILGYTLMTTVAWGTYCFMQGNATSKQHCKEQMNGFNLTIAALGLTLFTTALCVVKESGLPSFFNAQRLTTPTTSQTPADPNQLTP